MKKKRGLLAIGHTALDYIIKVKEFPVANASASIETMKNLYGGAAANVAMVGATIGLKTSLVSAVGKNFIDSEYHKQMQKLNIDTESLIISKNKDTPTAFVLTDENQDQISYFYLGAGKEFKKSAIPLKAIKKVEVVHLATGDPDFNCRSGIASKKEGKIVSFDPGQDLHLYDNKKLKEVIKNCNILFGNHFEIERILDSLSVDIEGLKELGPSIIIKTCGKDGSVIYNNHEKIRVDSVYRPATDPTGAGDSYRASFIHSYLNGDSLKDCAKFASSVSSFIVEKKGCQTNIPNFKEAKSRMRDFYNLDD
ncbi:adenosine kinase [Methanobrevibacter cuticularis]|uniref:Adenosine kinase n=1 Tax=Methanobrevibacter cuticularis TaxID=47311 RepID=A0A166D5X3_9EURY|nr:carbohydrate kinase family protein [Methanobrevibacter cuticularis]KZX15239.1 adenosine kinase [Methanobrevibacter cuticularis]